MRWVLRDVCMQCTLEIQPCVQPCFSPPPPRRLHPAISYYLFLSLLHGRSPSEARSPRAPLLTNRNEHEPCSCCLSFASMSLLSRLGLYGISNYGSILQPKSSTRSPPPSPQVEQRIWPREPYPAPGGKPANQYTLLEKLGTGSFGTVYKAIHNETQQIVAIKQIGGFLAAIKTETCSS